MSARDQLYEKLSAEYDAFIETLKSATPDIIIQSAYEKVFKEDIVAGFTDDEFLNDREIAALLALNNPLDELYQNWRDTDVSYMDDLRDTISDFAQRELERESEIGGEPIAEPEEAALPNIAEPIIPAKDVYTECVNGELRPGDLVISTPSDAYACLVGTVIEINKLGTPEHDTDNETDDVHVNFYDADYSDRRIAEIEDMFSDLYDEEKEFGECPIDDTIMAPDALIRITGIEQEKLGELLDSQEKAAAFCESALRLRKLTDRLTQNLNEYIDSFSDSDARTIIGEAGTISATLDAHYYLTENHEFEDAEVDYLLMFENPLEVVADKWYQRVNQLDDFPFSLDEVFDKQDALHGGYTFYTEPMPPEPMEPPASPAEKPADIKQAARYEAERLLYELKRLNKPNNPNAPVDEYMVKISPEFIRQAGDAYDKLLFEAFAPHMPMTFSSSPKEGAYLSMRPSVRAAVKVVKPSISEQLKEAREQAAAHNAQNSSDKHRKREGEVL